MGSQIPDPASSSAEGLCHDDDKESYVASTKVDEKELSINLEPSLLRGVPLDVALSGCGKHWKTPDSGMFHVDPKNYSLSQPTPSLDDFLSHDWASRRSLKFLSLLIVYNSRAGFWSTLAASVLVGILRAGGGQTRHGRL